MQNLLVLEHDSISEELNNYLVRESKNYDNIFKFERLFGSKYLELKEFLKTNLITHIIFQTTWLRKDSTEYLYQLISKLPQDLVIFTCTDSNVSLEILDAIELNTKEQLEVYLNMQRHKIFQVNFYNRQELKKQEWVITNNPVLKEAEDKIAILKNQETELKEIFNRPKAEYVKIGKVTAFGKEWSNLKEGDIVPLLRTPSTDTSPYWGVWVQGLTEPVKLLNSDFQIEYEYLGKKQENGTFKLTAEGIAREIVSSVRNTGDSKKEWVNLLKQQINRLNLFVNESNTLHSFVQEKLDTLGIPRRHYRNYFKNKLEEYNKTYSYIREIPGWA